MKKIRVVHVTSSLKVGGAEATLYSLIYTTRHQFDHHVVYIHPGPYVEQLLALGVSVQQVKGYFFTVDPTLVMRLIKILRQIKPDCVHTLLWAANVVGRVAAHFLRIPVVSVFHNNIDQDGRLKNFFDRYTVGYATRLVAVSEQVMSGYSRMVKKVTLCISSVN